MAWLPSTANKQCPFGKGHHRSNRPYFLSCSGCVGVSMVVARASSARLCLPRPRLRGKLRTDMTRKRYHKSRKPAHRCKFMNSRFPGVCAETGESFPTGTRIAWDSENKLSFNSKCPLVKAAREQIYICKDGRDVSDPATESSCLESAIDKFLRTEEPHRQEYGNKRQSNHYSFSGGGEAYVNKRGRCEDAPCCGCCS